MSQIRNATMLTLIVIVLCAGVLSSGCGQKGPLYIPETPASEESEDSDS
ncbi:lipoprotein [Gammaproteobacteria bacterium]|jgi:predicted small lipoprotein YifL|nr:lipoprotein [Gammaproteobacteria bacterium]